MSLPEDDPVRVLGLSKTFYDEGRGEVHAAREVSFSCRKGEIFGLLGANGGTSAHAGFGLCQNHRHNQDVKDQTGRSPPYRHSTH